VIEVTHDSISLRGAGIVTVAQPATGHRFTLDSVLLADFCRVRPRDRVLEPGAGTGVISLLLAKRHPRASFLAVDILPELCGLCDRNIDRNSLRNVTVACHDIRTLTRSIEPGIFDAVVVNPPYVRAGTGRTSPSAERNTARQANTPLGRWIGVQRFLKQGGRYTAVFPARRLAELLAALRRERLEPKRLRLVHAYADRTASLALIESVKAGGDGLEVLPPLIVHRPGGAYTEEMKDLYGLAGA
jgi:tRNA1(Val) A37 N6-methylase TrmN6